MKDNSNIKKVLYEKDTFEAYDIVEIKPLEARSITDAATRVKAYRAVFSTGGGM
jgi:hypothetical protein